MQIKVEVLKLEHEDIVNILSGFNSYSNYWCTFLDFTRSEYDETREEIAEEERSFEDILAKMLEKGQELYLTDDEDQTHTLTLEKLLKGLQITLDNGHVGIDDEDWDASDHDMIIQCAIFGEVIYG